MYEWMVRQEETQLDHTEDEGCTWGLLGDKILATKLLGYLTPPKSQRGPSLSEDHRKWPQKGECRGKGETACSLWLRISECHGAGLRGCIMAQTLERNVQV